VPDLVTAAGGLPVAARAGAPSVQTSWAAIREQDPDLASVSHPRAVPASLPGAVCRAG
jgi:iron complex transport system substrate-binding protein